MGEKTPVALSVDPEPVRAAGQIAQDLADDIRATRPPTSPDTAAALCQRSADERA